MHREGTEFPGLLSAADETERKSGKMATVEELIKQYQTDEELQKEVAEILARGKISPRDFLSFAKKHGVKVSLTDIPKYMEEAKKAGLIK